MPSRSVTCERWLGPHEDRVGVVETDVLGGPADIHGSGTVQAQPPWSVEAPRLAKAPELTKEKREHIARIIVLASIEAVRKQVTVTLRTAAELIAWFE